MVSLRRMARVIFTLLLFIGVAYVATKVMFDLPSSRTQRRLRLWVLGSAATVLACGLIWLVAYLATSAETREWLGRDIWWVVLLLVGIGVIGGCIWVEFTRA